MGLKWQNWSGLLGFQNNHTQYIHLHVELCYVLDHRDNKVITQLHFIGRTTVIKAPCCDPPLRRRGCRKILTWYDFDPRVRSHKVSKPVTILIMIPANERPRYNVPSSLIGWANWSLPVTYLLHMGKHIVNILYIHRYMCRWLYIQNHTVRRFWYTIGCHKIERDISSAFQSLLSSDCEVHLWLG